MILFFFQTNEGFLDSPGQIAEAATVAAFIRRIKVVFSCDIFAWDSVRYKLKKLSKKLISGRDYSGVGPPSPTLEGRSAGVVFQTEKEEDRFDRCSDSLSLIHFLAANERTNAIFVRRRGNICT